MSGMTLTEFLEDDCAICGWVPSTSGCDTLRAVALPYADHPDYDEAWRP